MNSMYSYGFLLLHYDWSGLRRNVDPNVKLSMVGWARMLVRGRAHRYQLRVLLNPFCLLVKSSFLCFIAIR